MKSVQVWDVFVRTFHWTLVGAILGMFLTAETFENAHVSLGYFVIVLVLARLFWGFFGTRHARFTDFVYGPGAIISYLKGLIKGNPKHYIGHNPAGGLMIIVMLLSLLVTAYTGLKTIGSEGRGPLAADGYSIVRPAYAHRGEPDGKNAEHPGRKHRAKNPQHEFWEEIHEGMTDFMIFLVVVHVGGVIVSSWIHQENLVLAMITGKKKLE
ncbi:MAG: cytochrome b/b6 domain-containing protein [Hyphomicrobiales bacterium]